MIYLVILTLVLLSIFLYLLIELKKSIHLVYIIPLSIIFTSGSYFYLDSMFGYPISRTDEKRFLLLSYYISSEEESINMWVMLDNETKPKAIAFPYDQDTHESLEEARKKMEGGEPVMGEFKEELEMGKEEGSEGKNNLSAAGTRKSSSGAFTLLDLDLKPKLPQKDYLLGD